MKAPFGEHKGKELREVPTEYLDWMATNIDGDDRKNGGKYAAKNQALIQACSDEINRRTDAGVVSFTPAQRKLKELPTIQLQPKNKDALLKEIRLLIDDLYKHASELHRLSAEYVEVGSGQSNAQYIPF